MMHLNATMLIQHGCFGDGCRFSSGSYQLGNTLLVVNVLRAGDVGRLDFRDRVVVGPVGLPLLRVELGQVVLSKVDVRLIWLDDPSFLLLLFILCPSKDWILAQMRSWILLMVGLVVRIEIRTRRRSVVTT